MKPAPIPTWRPAPWRAPAALAALAVGAALAAPGLATLDGRHALLPEVEAARLPALWVDAALPAAGAVDDERLREFQDEAEIELLLAEAMWGQAPPEAYALKLVRIDLGTRSRLALLDPTGQQPPRWVNDASGTAGTASARPATRCGDLL